MKFSPKNHILLISLLIFSCIQVVHCSDGNVEGVSQLQQFEEKIRVSLENDNNLKENLDKLINMIQLAFNGLSKRKKQELLDSACQLGAYFEDVIKNAIRYKYEYEYEYEYKYIKQYNDTLNFINPVDEQFVSKKAFKMKIGGEDIPYRPEGAREGVWVQYEIEQFINIADPEVAPIIFQEFFKNFFFLLEEYPLIKISVEYHMLKHMLANFFVFALGNKKTIESFINDLKNYERKGTTEQQLNTIFEVLIDSAARLYAYRVKERADVWNNASLRQKAWMKTMSFFKTPVSDVTIVFLAQEWNKFDHAGCATYFRHKKNFLYSSLIEYGIDEKTATKISEKAKIPALGTRWQKLWLRHKYKIIAAGATVITIGGIAALVKDQATREKIKQALISRVNQFSGSWSGWLRGLEKPALPPETLSR